MLIGRTAELKRLNNFYYSPKAEFLAVYGRRRIGKTYLITQFYQKKSALNFHATGLKSGTLVEQIANFTRIIGKAFYNGAELQNKARWLDVFEQLTHAINQQAHNKKIILFFDELPWMATQRSKLIQALDYYWNRYWSIDPRVKLIVCGSSASWILENLIHNKGGLYNRITYQIELPPFTLSESKTFLQEKGCQFTATQLLKLYMVMGGIPLYLDHLQKNLSADQNIDELCFTKNGLLFSEFNKLFESLFEQHDIHEELIRIIATHRYGMSQLEVMRQSSKSVGGRLKKRLQELEDAGFIESFVPYHHKAKGIYYRVVDEYSLFYLKWIDPVLNSLKRRRKEYGYWLERQNSNSFASWSGYAFEGVCYKHVSHIRHALKINPGAEIGTWRYAPKNNDQTGAQIDLLFDDQDAITICEIKYNAKPFVVHKEYAHKLLNKIDVYQQQHRTNKQFLLVMITLNGLKPSMYSEEMINGVVTLADLLKDL